MMLISSLLVTATMAAAEATLASSRSSRSRMSPLRTTARRSRSATLGAGGVGLDQLEAQLGVAALDLAREEQADIAAAADHQPVAQPLLEAERREGAVDVRRLDDEVDLVAGQDLVVGVGMKNRSPRPMATTTSRSGNR